LNQSTESRLLLSLPCFRMSFLSARIVWQCFVFLGKDSCSLGRVEGVFCPIEKNGTEQESAVQCSAVQNTTDLRITGQYSAEWNKMKEDTASFYCLQFNVTMCSHATSQCAAMQRHNVQPCNVMLCHSVFVPSLLMSLRSLYATTPCYIIIGMGSTYGGALILREAKH
jgi:hypothetical protein